MTKIAVWCRHSGDNIIGIGASIPWNVPSDAKFFRRVTENTNLVCGRATYESFPNHNLLRRKIYVLTSNAEYEVSDPAQHIVVTDIKAFKDFDEPLYIGGGAQVYKLFMQKQAPEIVVDCCYNGALDASLKGEIAEITSCIERLHKSYRQISIPYEKDNVTTTIWLKKGEFVPQEILKHIVLTLENND
jgi:hypothetical protein